MIAPPSEGDPYTDVPDNAPNPGATGAGLAWNNWRTFCGPVLDSAINDLRALPFVTA